MAVLGEEHGHVQQRGVLPGPLGDVHHHRDRAAVVAAQLQLHFRHRGLQAQQRLQVGLPEDAPAHGQQLVQPQLADQVVAIEPEQAAQRGIGLEDAAVGRGQQQPAGRLFVQRIRRRQRGGGH
nr:hypothetical protein [Ramlibacter montanisoli]